MFGVFFCFILFLTKKKPFALKSSLVSISQLSRIQASSVGHAKKSCHEEMRYTDAAAASLSKGAFKLVFDEASPDLERQSTTQPAVNASFTP